MSLNHWPINEIAFQLRHRHRITPDQTSSFSFRWSTDFESSMPSTTECRFVINAAGISELLILAWSHLNKFAKLCYCSKNQLRLPPLLRCVKEQKRRTYQFCSFVSPLSHYAPIGDGLAVFVRLLMSAVEDWWHPELIDRNLVVLFHVSSHLLWGPVSDVESSFCSFCYCSKLHSMIWYFVFLLDSVLNHRLYFRLCSDKGPFPLLLPHN